MIACTLHKTHRPTNLTTEKHHVIPVAWQVFYTPPGAPTIPTPRGGVWDPRTVVLCPTGHRNVHHWIEALMHGSNHPGRAGEVPIARLALDRFVVAGGSLDALRAAHEWGQA